MRGATAGVGEVLDEGMLVVGGEGLGRLARGEEDGEGAG